jgi:hypothetical protein
MTDLQIGPALSAKLKHRSHVALPHPSRRMLLSSEPGCELAHTYAQNSVELAGTGGFEPQHGGIKNRPATLISLRIFSRLLRIFSRLRRKALKDSSRALRAASLPDVVGCRR